ncbi:MAG: AsmA family protein, partial [Myxococcota bacterium]
TLPLDSAAPLQADLHTGKVTFASLQGVLPPFREAVARQGSLRGELALDVEAAAQGGHQQAKASIALTGVELSTRGFEARGDGTISVDLAPTGDSVVVAALADLTTMMLRSDAEDGSRVLDKPQGMPLRVKVNVAKSGSAAEVEEAAMEFGGTRVAGRGRATGLDGPSPVLDVDFGNVDIAFDDLRRTLPGAGQLPAGGTFKARLKLIGAPTALSTVGVDVSDLGLRFGRSEVRGQLKLHDLESPAIDAKLDVVKVAFDDLAPLLDEDTLPKGGRYEGKVDLSHPPTASPATRVAVHLDRLELAGSNLAGNASVVVDKDTRFAFDLRGDNLDLDAISAAFEEGDESSSKGAPSHDDNPHGLSKSTRESLARVSGEGKIRAASVVYAGLPMQNFVGSLRMQRGVVEFEALDFGIYGGTVSAKGTSFQLPAEYTGYGLKLKVEGLDLGSALKAHSDIGDVLLGKVSQDIDLTGRGLAKADLISSLQGPTTVRSSSLRLGSLDLLGPVLRSLSEGAKKIPGAPPVRAAVADGTQLQDVEAWLRLQGGRWTLERPLVSKTAFGQVTFTGGAGLDDKLALDALLALSPSTIKGWTGGKVIPKDDVTVPLKVGGTWQRPEVKGPDASTLARSVFVSALGAGLEQAGSEALSAATSQAQEAKRQAESAAKEAAAAAEAEAKRAADEVKRKAEDVKRQAEQEAKRKADELKKKAEQEAKKKADDAKKKPEQEAKKKADDAKKKAEKEAKKLLGL